MNLATITYLVRDYDEAIAYFTRALGFALVEDTKLSESKRWVIVSADGGSNLLLAKAATEEQLAAVGNQAGGRVAFFLQTDDFATTHRRLLAAGVEFVEPPRDEPYGTVVVFRDLYGNKWDLIGPAGKPIA